MKNKLFSLMKVRISSDLKFLKKINIKNDNKSYIGIIVACVIVAAILGYSTTYSFVFFDILSKYNMQGYLIPLFYVISALVTFILTIHKAKTSLFNSKDNELLFSMPIKISTIFASRFLYLLSINYFFSFVFFAPAVCVYGILSHVSVMFYLLAFMVFLLIPLIPTVIASIIGYFIAYISSMVKRKNVVEILLSSILLLALIFSQSIAQSQIMKYITNVSVFEALFKKYGNIFYYAYDGIINMNIISVIIYVAINVVVFLLFISIFSIKYKNIIVKLKEIKTSKNKKEVKYLTRNKIKSLVVKELKRYISIPTYVLNTSFAMILLVFFVISNLFANKDMMNSFLGVEGMQISAFAVSLAITLFAVSMSNTACASISLEGKNIWLSKSLPINTKDIFKSKIILNNIIVIPITIICILVIGVITKLTILQIVLNILITVILNNNVAKFGILINLKFPKLEYTNEIQVVKQSMASFIGIMFPMIIVLVLMMIYFSVYTTISLEVYVAIITCVLFAINLLQNKILNAWGIKRFSEI